MFLKWCTCTVVVACSEGTAVVSNHSCGQWDMFQRNSSCVHVVSEASYRGTVVVYTCMYRVVVSGGMLWRNSSCVHVVSEACSRGTDVVYTRMYRVVVSGACSGGTVVVYM